MEAFKQLQFIFPPSVLIGAVLAAFWLDNDKLLCALNEWKDHSTVLIAIFAASVIPLGFAIGGFTRFALRIWFCRKKHEHETLLDDAQLEKLWKVLGIQATRSKDNELTAQREFSDQLNDRTNQQIERYWNAVMTYSGGVTALAVAAAIVGYYQIKPGPLWWSLLAALALLFFLIADRSREGLRRQLVYWLDRPWRKAKPATSASQRGGNL